jgi:hypothetical protein
MSNITRYDFVEKWAVYFMDEVDDGDFVKYEDVKHLIERDKACKPKECISINYVEYHQCVTCKKSIGENDKFCRNCGQKLRDDESK